MGLRRQRRRQNDKVIISSPETEKALDYAKALVRKLSYLARRPGTTHSTTRHFWRGEIHWTNNGISIYVAAQNDASKKQIAEDMDHALYPVGPIGKPTEFHLLFPLMAMTYTKYPQACKALMAYMLEAEQFNQMADGIEGLSDALP